MTHIERNWMPPGPVANDFFYDTDHFVQSLVGPVGSGKSVAGFIKILYYMGLRKPDADGVVRMRAAIIRNTYGMLRSATVPTITKWWPSNFGKLTIGTSPITLQVKTPKMHLHIDMLGLDQDEDVRKLLSTEYSCAWIDEAREIPWAIMMALLKRVGRAPEDKGNPTGVWCTSNPSPVEHWLCKKNTIELPSDWCLYKQPSGLSDAAENLHNLNGGRAYYERICSTSDQDDIKVFVHGEWGYVRVGDPVFPQYVDSLHVAPGPIAVIDRVPIVLGFDFGISPACLWLQQDPATSRWNVLDEMTPDGVLGIAATAQAIKRITEGRFSGYEIAGWCDPAGSQQSPLSDKTQYDILREVTGYRWRPAPSFLFANRRDAVIEPMTRLLSDGKPRLQIDPRCVTLRQALAGKFAFRSVRSAAGPQVVDDPIKNHPWSDVGDALGYALLGAGEVMLVSRTGKQRREDRPKIAEGADYDVFGYNGGSNDNRENPTDLFRRR